MKFMSKDLKRSISSDVTCGLYIEIKEFSWYKDTYDVDVVELLYT
jgi:hypothetical protein